MLRNEPTDLSSSPGPTTYGSAQYVPHDGTSMPPSTRGGRGKRGYPIIRLKDRLGHIDESSPEKGLIDRFESALTDVIHVNADSLRKKGIDVDKLVELGGGSYGIAFDAGNGRALKVTYDRSEAIAANKIKGKRLERIYNVYDVFKFKRLEDATHDDIYGIVAEKLEKLSHDEQESLDHTLADVLDALDTTVLTMGKFPWSDLFKKISDGGGYDAARKLDELGIGKMNDELMSMGIVFDDLHPLNVLKRRSGEYVLIDLGAESTTKGGQEPSMLEGWDSSTPLRQEASTFTKWLPKFAGSLRKKGIDVKALKPLGHGSYGVTFDAGSNRVLKVTRDDSEAKTSLALVKKPTKHIVRIYDVFRFNMSRPGHNPDIYGIIQERLEPLDSQSSNVIGKALNVVSQHYELLTGRGFISHERYDWKRMKEDLMGRVVALRARHSATADEVEKQIRVLEDFDIGEIIDELSANGVRFGDFHPGNIMKRGSDYVVVDLGSDSSVASGMREPPSIDVESIVIGSIVDGRRAVAGSAGATLHGTDECVVSDSSAPTIRYTKIYDKIVDDNAALLMKNGIDVSGSKALGAGGYGVAYGLSNGKVFKVTHDRYEAISANKLKGRKLKHVYNVEQVFKFPRAYEGMEFYGVLTERLEKLSQIENALLNRAIDGFYDATNERILELGTHDWKEVERKISGFSEQLLELTRKLSLGEMNDELKSVGIKFGDVHVGNVMKRGSDYVAIDVGPAAAASADPEPATLETICRLVESTLLESRADRIAVTLGTYQPFHKGHASVIRRLTTKFDRVVVAVKEVDGGIPFETTVDVMKKSLPDVFSKVEAHRATFGGKPSDYLPGVLSDIVSGKRSAVRSDSAVNILVGDDRIDSVREQFSSARDAADSGSMELAFDPSLCVVARLPDAKSDGDAGGVSSDDALEAVRSGDEASRAKAFDAHLVSNPSDLDAAMDEIGRAIGSVDESISSIVSELVNGAMHGSPGTVTPRTGTSAWSSSMSKPDERDGLWQNQLTNLNIRNGAKAEDKPGDVELEEA